MRQQVRQNPQILPQLIAYLQQNNPTLYNLFTQQPELLRALILGGGGGAGAGGAGGQQPDGRHVIRLTQEESDAINRLTTLGFDRYAAAQAYLSCDKNEELAANMLLENATSWRDDPAPPAPVQPNIPPETQPQATPVNPTNNVENTNNDTTNNTNTDTVQTQPPINEGAMQTETTENNNNTDGNNTDGNGAMEEENVQGNNNGGGENAKEGDEDKSIFE